MNQAVPVVALESNVPVKELTLVQKLAKPGKPIKVTIALPEGLTTRITRIPVEGGVDAHHLVIERVEAKAGD